jgi:hypothetical protein
MNLLRKPKITKRFAKEEWKAEVDGQNNLTRLAYRRRSLLRDEVQRTEPQKSIASTRRIDQRLKPVERNKEVVEGEEASHALPALTTTTATLTGLDSTPAKIKTSEELVDESNFVTENNKINLEGREEIENDTLAKNGTGSDKYKHIERSESLLKTNITTTTEILEAQSVSTSHRKRRPSVAIRSETQASPLPASAALTMSESLYNHFRPLDKEVPEDHLLPFLDFGKKLVPVNAKTTSPVAISSSTSSTNSIEAVSTSPQTPTLGQNNLLATTPLKFTSSNARAMHIPREDEIHEDMDVSVVKSVVEKNKAARSRGGSLQFLRNLGGLYRKHETLAHEVVENVSSVSIAPSSSTEKNGLKTENPTENHSDSDKSGRNEMELVQDVSTTLSATEYVSTSDTMQRNTDSTSHATTERSVTLPIKNYTNISSYRRTAEPSTNKTPKRLLQASDVSTYLAPSPTSQSRAATQFSASSIRIEATVSTPYLRGRAPLVLRNKTSLAVHNRRLPATFRHPSALPQLSKPVENTSKPSENILVYNESNITPEKSINPETISDATNLDEKSAVTNTSAFALQLQPASPSIRTGREESANVATEQAKAPKLINVGEKLIVHPNEPMAELEFSTKTNASLFEQTVQNVGTNILSQLSVENVTATLISSTFQKSSHTSTTIPTEIPFITSSIQSPTTKILSTAVVTSVSVKGAWPLMVTETPPLEQTLIPPQSYGSENMKKELVEHILESPGRYVMNQSHSSIKESTTNKTHHMNISAQTSLPLQFTSNSVATDATSDDRHTSTYLKIEGNVLSDHSKDTTAPKNITSNNNKNITYISTEDGLTNTMTSSMNKTRHNQAFKSTGSNTAGGEVAVSNVTEVEGLAKTHTNLVLTSRRGHGATSRVRTPKATTPNPDAQIFQNLSDPKILVSETVRTKQVMPTLPEYVKKQVDTHSTSIPVAIKSPPPDADFDFPLLKLYNTSAVWTLPAGATTKEAEESRVSTTEYPSTGNGSTTVTNNSNIMEASTHKVVVVTKGSESVNSTSGVYKGESRNDAAGQVGNEETRPNTEADVRNNSDSGVNLLLDVGNGLSRDNATVGTARPGETAARMQGVTVVVYVLSALGIIPVAIGVAFVARYCVQRRRKVHSTARGNLICVEQNSLLRRNMS